jgi:hypothetical protein
MEDKISAAKNKVKAREILEDALAEIHRMGLLTVIRDGEKEVAVDIWNTAYSERVEIFFDEI